MGNKGKTIVIGAGMAGLTAAHFLKEAGYEVIIVEQDNRPGGRIMSIQKDNDTIDVGAQFFHTNYDLTLKLIKKFGLESDLAEMKNADMIMRDGVSHIIPWGGVRIPAISLWSQIRMVKLLLPLLRRRKDFALDAWPNLLDLDKLDMTTYTLMKLDEDALDYMVRVLMLTYSMSEPTGISVGYFLRSLYMYATTGASCFRSGNDALAKAMAKDLDIRYETAVKGITCDTDGRVKAVQTSKGEIEGSALISAIPSPALLPLYNNWSDKQQSFLETFEYSKLPLVMFEGPVRKEVTYWGGLFDYRAGHRISFITYPHMKYENSSSDRYLLAWPLGDLGAELIDLSDEKIIAAVTAELKKASPADAAEIESATVVRHLHTYPQYKVGMFKRVLQFKASEGQPAGLYFAGDYTEGGLIEGAAQSGYKAAQRVMADSK